MNKNLLLTAITTALLVSGCSMSSGEEPTVKKPPYAHPDFSIPKPSPYQVIGRAEQRTQHLFVFEFDSSELPEDASRNIKPHVDYLKSFPNRKVAIQGTADSAGGNEYNYSLGDKRARTIADLFLEHGVEASQIVITSAGEARSIYVPSRSVILAY